jgi:hypothetical protein
MYETISSIVRSPLAVAGIGVGFMVIGVMVGIAWELIKPSTTTKAATPQQKTSPIVQSQNSATIQPGSAKSTPKG